MSFVLEASNVGSITAQLKRLAWLPELGFLSATRIGDGNMNMTVRVQCESCSFVLKQARPWVVKYPHIAAPIERAAVEAEFYQVTAASLAMPRLIGFDAESSLLCLEDLGVRGDLSALYQAGEMSEPHCIALTDYLSKLHCLSVPEASIEIFRNRAMRKLNEEHQYDLPLHMDTGLGEELKRDEEYCGRIAQLAAIYRADGSLLVHGDFFPGSWMVTENGVAVIDPEFCFLGVAEYDLGIFLAHLEFVRGRALWGVVQQHYLHSVNWALVRRFAGAEIMRRLMGVAQLPLKADLDQKRQWLDFSRELVCAD